MAQVKLQVEPLEAFPSRDFQKGDAILNPGFVETIDSDTTLDNSQVNVLADGSSNTVALTLPEPTEGQEYFIKAIDATNNITVDTTGAADIDGADSQTLTAQYDYVHVISDGTNWFIKSAVIT